MKLKLSVVQGYKCLKYESDDFVELTLLKDYNRNDKNDNNDDKDEVADDTPFQEDRDNYDKDDSNNDENLPFQKTMIIMTTTMRNKTPTMMKTYPSRRL